MKIELTKINEMEFVKLQGALLVTEVNDAGVQALSYPEHTSMDEAPVPFWATEVQDMLERQCVTYSPEDIKNGNFLGARIQAFDERVEVSLGHVGETDAEITMVFKKNFDADGNGILGRVLTYGNFVHIAV